MTDVASTPGRTNTFQLQSAASTNSTNVKASAGYLFSATISNSVVGTATRYLKIYDKATAPTVGTDRPILQLPVLQSSATVGSGLTTIFFPEGGVKFSNGIGISLNTGAADSDTGAVAANECKVVLQYR